ncbi:hypothetical protein ABD71_14725 [Brevibacillus laterosporus]|nr:hypothetical protein [Brevibacillus laterosporus]
MFDSKKYTLSILGAVLLDIVINVFLAWVVSVLVSFVFGIDFGFWQSLASIILLSITSKIFFSKMPTYE